MSLDLNLIEIAEPELLFGYGQSMEHPKDGLLLYGPKESPQAGAKLRIGVVSTKEGLRRYSACVARLAKPIAPALADNPNHTLFPGFQALFGVEWPAQPATWLEIDASELANAIRISDRHQAIHKAVSLYSDARTDGRWAQAYAGSADMVIPADFIQELEKCPAAKSRFETLNRSSLFTIYLALQTAKRPETRVKRIERFIDALAGGRQLA